MGGAPPVTVTKRVDNKVLVSSSWFSSSFLGLANTWPGDGEWPERADPGGAEEAGCPAYPDHSEQP